MIYLWYHECETDRGLFCEKIEKTLNKQGGKHEKGFLPYKFPVNRNRLYS
jgi:hypothetical protein